MPVPEYQQDAHYEYEGALQRATDRLLRHLGVEWAASARLIFIERRPPFEIVIEEDGTWNAAAFSDATRAIEEEQKRLVAEEERKEPRQRLFLGGNRDMRSVAVDAIMRRFLEKYDADTSSTSLVEGSQRILNLDVVALIQFDNRALNLEDVVIGGKPVSLVRAACSALLSHAISEVHKFEAWPTLREHPYGLLREAAERVLQQALARRNWALSSGLYTSIDAISAMGYERRGARGTLAFPTADVGPALTISFAQPVPLRETRWARKLVELSAEGLAVVVDEKNRLAGLTRDFQKGARAQIIGRHEWELAVGDQVLFRSRDGAVSLTRAPVDADGLRRSLERVFPEMGRIAAEKIWPIVARVVGGASHGALLIVSSAAEAEANGSTRTERRSRRRRSSPPTPSRSRALTAPCFSTSTHVAMASDSSWTA